MLLPSVGLLTLCSFLRRRTRVCSSGQKGEDLFIGTAETEDILPLSEPRCTDYLSPALEGGERLAEAGSAEVRNLSAATDGPRVGTIQARAVQTTNDEFTASVVEDQALEGHAALSAMAR